MSNPAAQMGHDTSHNITCGKLDGPERQAKADGIDVKLTSRSQRFAGVMYGYAPESVHSTCEALHLCEAALLVE